ncbi:MAG: metallophosphoesterase [Propionicimonas sp.]
MKTRNSRARGRLAAPTLALAMAAAAFAGASASSSPANAATDACVNLTSGLHQTVDPNRLSSAGVQLLSTSAAEIANSAKYGFTKPGSDLGSVSPTPQTSLVGVHRLYQASTGVFTWSADPADIAPMVSAGWTDQKISFYAATSADTCTVKAERFTKSGAYRTITAEAEKANLKSRGWASVPAGAFYVKSNLPAAPDTKFSIAVIPDTQIETNDPANARFLNRTNWLASNKTSLDLRYVLHTGDVTNWGWLDQPQIDRAKRAMAVLTTAKIPYAITIGNHDTAAVGWNGIAGSSGYGGSAYMSNPECPIKLGKPACRSIYLVRNTAAFNTGFPVSSIKDVGGVFQAGRIDNIWTSFDAGGKKWLVLTLELWPRQAVLDWAKTVITSHAGDNVLIQTHSFLDANGAIYTAKGGYGSTTPKALFDQLVAPNPNVKMVFSGHVGTQTSRTDSPSGHKVLSFLMNDLGYAYNPVRILEIDTAAGTVTSRVVSPKTGVVIATTSATGMTFVG